MKRFSSWTLIAAIAAAAITVTLWSPRQQLPADAAPTANQPETPEASSAMRDGETASTAGADAPVVEAMAYEGVVLQDDPEAPVGPHRTVVDGESEDAEFGLDAEDREILEQGAIAAQDSILKLLQRSAQGGQAVDLDEARKMLESINRSAQSER